MSHAFTKITAGLIPFAATLGLVTTVVVPTFILATNIGIADPSLAKVAFDMGCVFTPVESAAYAAGLLIARSHRPPRWWRVVISGVVAAVACLLVAPLLAGLVNALRFGVPFEVPRGVTIAVALLLMSIPAFGLGWLSSRWS